MKRFCFVGNASSHKYNCVLYTIDQLIPKCTCGEKAHGVVWMTCKCVAKSDHNLESYSPTSHSVATALCIILHTHKISSDWYFHNNDLLFTMDGQQSNFKKVCYISNADEMMK